MKPINFIASKYYLDKTYTGTEGVTDQSVAFWKVIRENLGRIEVVDVRFNTEEWHRVLFSDIYGTSIEFTGFVTGYDGTGPRALAKILDELGFPQSDIDRVYREKVFTLRR